MSTKWSEASGSVENMAQRLIEQYHPHLKEANIAFIFRSDAASSKGRTVLAQAALFPVKLFPISQQEFDFLIWISEEDWTRMENKRKEALIDHELCHCKGSRDGGWRIIGHDVEEFAAIIERHGLWNADLISMSDKMEKYRQLSFDQVTRQVVEGENAESGKVVTIEVQEGELEAVS